MIIQKSLSFILARGIPGAVGLLTIVFFTRLLSPEIYGQYAILLSMSGLMITLFYQWMQFAVLRYYHKNEVDESVLKGTLLSTFLTISLIVSPLFLLFLNTAFDYVYLSLSLIVLLLMLAHSFFDLSTHIPVSSGDAGIYGVLLTLKSVLGLTLGVLLISLGYQLLAPLLGLALSYALWSIYLFFKYWRKLSFINTDKRLLKSMLHYGLPLSGTFIMNYIMSNSDRLMLAWLIDDASAGLYAAPFDLSNFTFIVILISIHLAIYPMIVKAYEKNEKQKTHELLGQNLIILLLVSILPAVIFSLLVVDLSQLVFGEQFWQQAIDVIPIIALATFFMGLKAYYFDLVFLLQHKTQYMLWMGVSGALINILLNYWFILEWGIMGAAYSTCFSYFVILCLSFVLGRKLLQLPFPGLNIAKVCIVFIICAGLMWQTTAVLGMHLLLSLALLMITFSVLVYLFDFFDCRKLVNSLVAQFF